MMLQPGGLNLTVAATTKIRICKSRCFRVNVVKRSVLLN